MSQNDLSVFVNEDVDFQKISVHRFFLPVPVDVTWAGKAHTHPYTIVLHTICIPPPCEQLVYHFK